MHRIHVCLTLFYSQAALDIPAACIASGVSHDHVEVSKVIQGQASVNAQCPIHSRSTSLFSCVGNVPACL